MLKLALFRAAGSPNPRNDGPLMLLTLRCASSETGVDVLKAAGICGCVEEEVEGATEPGDGIEEVVDDRGEA